MEGFDYSTRGGSSLAAAVVKAGGKFVIRYLSSHSKGITTAERDSLHKDNVGIGVVYETTGTTFTGGHSAGVADGVEAARQAELIGVPHGDPIFFAIDTDTSDFKTVRLYLQGCQAGAPNYAAKLYASFKVIEAIGGDGHWQTYAWSGKSISKHAGVYQYHNGYSVGGTDTDRCRTLPGGPGISGGWLTYGAVTPVTPGPSAPPVPVPSPGPVLHPVAASKDELRVLGNADPHVHASLAYAAKEHVNPSQGWARLCLAFCNYAAGAPHLGGTALDAWNRAGKAHQHGYYNPPAGVPVFWDGGSGHVAWSDGKGNVWSNDILRAGKIDLVPIALIAKKWGKKYLGWTDTLNGKSVYTHPAAAATPLPAVPAGPAPGASEIPAVPAPAPVTAPAPEAPAEAPAASPSPEAEAGPGPVVPVVVVSPNQASELAEIKQEFAAFALKLSTLLAKYGI